jgi:hypothetical protein
VLFAFDSIPAVFGITDHAYIVFAANAFALLGLRPLFFLISGLLDRLVYMSTGLAAGRLTWGTLCARDANAGRYLPVRSRCLHPGQQQGRRWPSSSSSWVRRMRRSRVLSCLASWTQQMNSLRAKGVMSFQATSAVALAISA